MGNNWPNLEDFDGFCAAVRATQVNDKEYSQGMRPYYGEVHFEPTRGTCFCPGCCGIRTVDVHAVGVPEGFYFREGEDFAVQAAQLRMKLECSQCETVFDALVLSTGEKPRHVLLPSARAALTTQNTPEPVRYYLDQASRAGSTGANTAAVVMFRTALEHLLYEQGYQQGMLKKKIEDAFAEASRASWADRVGKDVLDVLRILGNFTAHANDGTIDGQESFDQRALVDLHITFRRLLDAVYEPLDFEGEEMQGLRALAEKLGD